MDIDKVHTKTVEEVLALLDDMKTQIKNGSIVDGRIEILNIDDHYMECKIKHHITIDMSVHSGY